ncbi:MAG: ribosome silencing factor [Holosporales bacterium]|jgi:ribosome-associated protein|nr:ribosome silencing factor [Holosporales bacterium]
MVKENIKDNIIKLLIDKKAESISEIDLSSDSSKLSDTCIIASGTSSKHIESVAESVYRYLKTEKFAPKVEGSGQSGWVLIESLGIEIHFFKPKLREYYDLESLYSSAVSSSVF